MCAAYQACMIYLQLQTIADNTISQFATPPSNSTVSRAITISRLVGLYEKCRANATKLGVVVFKPI
jgi:hypothetical protein